MVKEKNHGLKAQIISDSSKMAKNTESVHFNGKMVLSIKVNGSKINLMVSAYSSAFSSRNANAPCTPLVS